MFISRGKYDWYLSLEETNTELEAENNELHTVLNKERQERKACEEKIEKMSEEISTLNYQLAQEKSKEFRAMCNRESDAVAAAKAGAENKVLRQILTDITGKDPDELIAAYHRAIRLLEYGVKPQEEKKE